MNDQDTSPDAEPNEKKKGNPPANWTLNQDEELRILRAEQGAGITTIAKQLGRAEKVVTRRCNELKLKPPQRKPRPPATPPAPPVPKAGPVTLEPLPSLLEPIYLIPKR